MLHRCALDCSQLRAGALWCGLMVGLLLAPVHGDVGWQKDVSLPKPVDGSMSFRLGSGAVATGYSDLTMNVIAPPKLTLLKSKRSSAGETLSPTPLNSHDLIPIYKKVNQNLAKLLGIAVVSVLFYMMPGLTTDRNNFNYRIPPSWSPENPGVHDRHFPLDSADGSAASPTVRRYHSAPWWRSQRDGENDHATGNDQWRYVEPCDG